MLVATLTLCAASLSGAQSPPVAPAAKHFRLKVVLANPQDASATQSFVFDVPVSADHTGQAEMHLAASPTAEAQAATS